jgi:hypothetical protein
MSTPTLLRKLLSHTHSSAVHLRNYQRFPVSHDRALSLNRKLCCFLPQAKSSCWINSARPSAGIESPGP